MKTSCGAILYTYDPNGHLGIILGLEGFNWLPFKGCMEKDESPEQTAIREIKEETCGLLSLDGIRLEHHFSSKSKHYRIGLCEAPFGIIEQFSQKRNIEFRDSYKEKVKLKFFSIYNVLKNDSIHQLTKASIRFYWNKLMLLNNGNCLSPSPSPSPTARKQSVNINYAKRKYIELVLS